METSIDKCSMENTSSVSMENLLGTRSCLQEHHDTTTTHLEHEPMGKSCSMEDLLAENTPRSSKDNCGEMSIECSMEKECSIQHDGCSVEHASETCSMEHVGVFMERSMEDSMETTRNVILSEMEDGCLSLGISGCSNEDDNISIDSDLLTLKPRNRSIEIVEYDENEAE